MDKLTCNIVRDLMPLVLDDIASEDSKEGVRDHIETCETCRAYFEGMSMQISRALEPVSDKSFAKFCRDVKRRNIIKKAVMIALIVILMGIVGVTGITIINGQRYSYVDMPISGATAQLYLDSGDVVMLDVRANDGYEIYWYPEEIRDCGDNEIIVYMSPVEPKLKLGNNGDTHRRDSIYGYVWKNGQLYKQDTVYNSYSGAPDVVDFKVLSMRWGTAEENIELYNAGDILPDRPDGVKTPEVTDLP